MLSEEDLHRVLAQLHRERMREWPRLNLIRCYLRGDQTDLYVPKAAGEEFRRLIEMSHFNILPRVVSASAQDLYVDGYRPTGPSGRAPTVDNSPIWAEVWQANRLDARQAGLFRSAISYGVAYATVLPGDPAPVITPWSPLRLTAIYDDPINDEWPRYALALDTDQALTGGAGTIAVAGGIGLAMPRGQSCTARLFDSTHVHTITVTDEGVTVTDQAEHGLGVCPVVRFVEAIDLDGCPRGKVEPLIPLQRQIDQTTYSLLMTQQYQAFRQRWATGMAIDVDDSGAPIQPWNASVAEVWVNDSPDGRFGDFAETSLAGYLESRTSQILFASSIAQIPPHHLVIGNAVSNISADALVALEAAHRQDVAEHQTVFGESLEQLLRLAGLAHGDETAWADMAAQVVWRDTTPRSLAEVADAYGKLATMLEIPPRALWERLPGVTDQDLARWDQMAAERSPMVELQRMLDQPTQAAPGQAATTAAGVDHGNAGAPAPS